ncbi:MAG TPA: hypothetical protein VEQ10_03455 [Vicinamibacteria bacterium]|nr:hypothetical protein [Vicinamibacteria bacterium]
MPFLLLLPVILVFLILMTPLLLVQRYRIGTARRQLVMLVVVARVLFGFWRAFHLWQATGAHAWVVATGAAESLAAGAVVLGYYLVYWTGVRWRVRRRGSGFVS